MSTDINKKIEQYTFPALPHRRKLSTDELKRLSVLCSRAFKEEISVDVIERIVNYISYVEKRIVGRIACHAEDLVINYLMRYFSSTIDCSFNNTVHMEIGTLFGGSVILAYQATRLAEKEFSIHVIDPLEGYYDKGKDIITNEDVNENNFNKNLRTFKIPRNRIILHKEFSNNEKVIESCKSLKVLSLLIDGDHSYNGIKNDWINYSHLVVPGGYILLDNYNDQYWPEVMAFINKEVLSNLRGKWEYVLNYSNSLLLRRTSVTGDVDVNETQRLFQELSIKEKKLTEIGLELETLKKDQIEKEMKLKEKLDEVSSLTEKLYKENEETKQMLIAELEKQRDEKENLEKSFENLNLEHRRILEQIKTEYNVRVSNLEKQLEESRESYKQEIERLQDERDTLIAQQRRMEDVHKTEKENLIANLMEKDKQIQHLVLEQKKLEETHWVEKDNLIAQLKMMEDKRKSEIDRIHSEHVKVEDDLREEITKIKSKYEQLSRAYHILINSLSWRIMKPLRRVKEFIFPNWKG